MDGPTLSLTRIASMLSKNTEAAAGVAVKEVLK
jgi:hypothetical protein